MLRNVRMTSYHTIFLLDTISHYIHTSQVHSSTLNTESLNILSVTGQD